MPIHMIVARGDENQAWLDQTKLVWLHENYLGWMWPVVLVWGVTPIGSFGLAQG